MLAGVTDCRRSWKWGCRGRLALGFKPRCGSLRGGGPCGFGEKREDHVVLRSSLLPCGLGSRTDFARKKREKGFLLVGCEKVPHGSGLTGDCGSHTADGARSLNHGLLLLFLRYGTPDWAEGDGRRKDCVCL